jgi:hypothetical protein
MDRKVEAAIRAAVMPGQELRTPSRKKPLLVDRIDTDGIVLLLGERPRATRLSWPVPRGDRLDLRHTHAALLIAAGEHPKVIESLLGHASISTTLDTYGHLFNGLDEAVADHIDDLWSQSQER